MKHSRTLSAAAFAFAFALPALAHHSFVAISAGSSLQDDYSDKK